MRIPHFLLGACLLLASLVPSTASAKWVFNSNHPDLEWYSIETEHFVTHYPVSKKSREEGNEHYLTGEWSARKMAQVAEQTWPKMCAEFNYYLKEKVHIVLLNQGDELAPGLFPGVVVLELLQAARAPVVPAQLQHEAAREVPPREVRAVQPPPSREGAASSVMASQDM